MSKYTRKQRQAPQDEFVGFWDKIFKKAEPYARAIGITVVTAGVLIAVVWGVMSWMERKSQAATEAFGHAVRVYEAELQTGDEPAKTDEENPVPRFKTEKERAEATLKELDEFDKKYGHSSTADEAMLFRAGVYYDLGRFDDSATAYEKFIKGAHASPLLLRRARRARAVPRAAGQARRRARRSISSSSPRRATSIAIARCGIRRACGRRRATRRRPPIG